MARLEKERIDAIIGALLQVLDGRLGAAQAVDNEELLQERINQITSIGIMYHLGLYELGKMGYDVQDLAELLKTLSEQAIVLAGAMMRPAQPPQAPGGGGGNLQN